LKTIVPTPVTEQDNEVVTQAEHRASLSNRCISVTRRCSEIRIGIDIGTQDVSLNQVVRAGRTGGSEPEAEYYDSWGVFGGGNEFNQRLNTADAD
jgi:hypothetical protein